MITVDELIELEMLITEEPRCLIKKDTEAKKDQKWNEAHCLIKEDTVAHGKNHEPSNPRRIP